MSAGAASPSTATRSTPMKAVAAARRSLKYGSHTLSFAPSTRRDAKNWLIHQLYVRQEFAECLEVIDDLLESVNGQCEYAIYVKGLIKRQQGFVHESLQLFQQATVLNPLHVANLKQVGRSLYLLGKHKQAIEVYKEAANIESEDWEIYHNQGLCYIFLKRYDEAIEALETANDIQRQDATYLQLGKVYTLQEKYEDAINVYQEALVYSPENPDILVTIGLLYLRLGDNFKAFDFLGNALTHNPKNVKSILAAGSIIQDHNDMDVALVKYRVAAVINPDSPQLWNNIGMCFFGKKRYVAAVSCLKRALYLDPFEWIIAYNLGLVHLNTGQFASAFHYLSASINLKSDFPSAYMYLAVCLSRLGDFNNSFAAYEKALQMDDSDFLFELNYAITLMNNGEKERAKEHYERFKTLYDDADEESRRSDPDVAIQMEQLKKHLNQ
eukprot:TRINITY_DN31181_c0_g1_i1.p1 TRINITY_DN31181_c0_g1~~TRINITY_DN31181_c0_g1_i1.p1  ORF type:complete len:493 (-),score=270.15 TRINITY_DN31181_c0_g1_i1:37-1356(-)